MDTIEQPVEQPVEQPCPPLPAKPPKKPLKEILTMRTVRELLFIALGSLFWVFALNVFIIPNELLSGGITGIALIINHYWQISVALLVFTLNIPVLILALKELDKHFFFYTIYAVCLQAILLEATKGLPAYHGDILLVCIFGGIISGIGCGIVIRQRGSSGGLDIIGIVIKKHFCYSVGTANLVVNCVIIGISALLFGLDIALYTIIYIASTNLALDKIIEGLSKNYTAMIVSNEPEAIRKEIFQRIHRGITYLHGEGGFSQQEKSVIFCVVNQFELATLKTLLEETDPEAFMTLSETTEVLGRFKKSNK